MAFEEAVLLIIKEKYYFSTTRDTLDPKINPIIAGKRYFSKILQKSSHIP